MLENTTTFLSLSPASSPGPVPTGASTEDSMSGGRVSVQWQAWGCPSDGEGVLGPCKRRVREPVASLFSLVKEEYSRAFCIQNVVQYFGMGHWCA